VEAGIVGSKWLQDLINKLAMTFAGCVNAAMRMISVAATHFVQLLVKSGRDPTATISLKIRSSICC
jgi:hypothetical protein